MKKAIREIISQMENVQSGYLAKLQFYYSNLCVTADPMALLSTRVRDEDGEPRHIEDVAYTGRPDDYHFEIIPKDKKLLPELVEGIKREHPEFDFEIIRAEYDRRIDPEDDEEAHIIYTMPEVDKNRHDVMIQTVNTLYDGCKETMTAVKAYYLAKLTTAIIGYEEEEAEEAKKAFEKKDENLQKIRDGYKENKTNEIEEAYKAYQEKEQKKEQEKQEDKAAKGDDILNSLNLNAED